MRFIPPAVFAMAITLAVMVIWQAVRQALPAIRTLKRELAGLAAASQPASLAAAKRDAAVRRLEVRGARAVQPARSRSRHHAQPKPVTHRLHHFQDEAALLRKIAARA